MLPPQAFRQIGQDGVPGGHHAVLIAVLLPAVGVPPHHIALRAAAQIGAPDGVEVVHAPAPQIAVGRVAAPGVDEKGVVAQGQLDVIGSGGADGADHPHLLHRLVDPQHPGDASLGHHLVDDVGLGLAQLGQGRLQVVEHDGHGAEGGGVGVGGLPGEGVHRAVVGRRLRGGGGGRRRCGGRRRGGGGGLRPAAGAAGGETQQARQTQGGKERSSHFVASIQQGYPHLTPAVSPCQPPVRPSSVKIHSCSHPFFSV